MEKRARMIEVTDGKGTVLLSFDMVEHPGEAGGNPAGEEKQALMTPAQKRYLFRLLASKGMEEDQAYQHLKESFQVDTLKEVTKIEASRMIDRLLEETKEQGGDGDGIPF